MVGANEIRTEAFPPSATQMTVGTGLLVNVPLPDCQAEPVQLTIVRTAQGWLFVDRSETSRCSFDGSHSIQYETLPSARTIIGLGDSWIVFYGTDLAHPKQGASQPLLRTAGPKAPHLEAWCGECRVNTAGSWGTPILIGTHPVADLLAETPGIEPFHGMIYWGNRTIYYQSFEMGAKAQALVPDDSGRCNLEDRGIPINIQFEGEMLRAARERRSSVRGQWQRLALRDDGSDESLVFSRITEQLSLGRDPCNQLQVTDASISRTHATLQAHKTYVMVTDDNSINGTYLNDVRLSPATPTKVLVGDRLFFGKRRFRLIYA